MKFTTGAWRDSDQQSPVHHGEYDARLRSGAEGRIEFRDGEWVRASTDIVEWRGRELVGVSHSRSARRAMDAYRAALHHTHSAAVESALFLARRAVSLDYRPDAYHFYLIANAIDRARLETVDKEWIERYAAAKPRTVAIEQGKADVFFSRRGGRPPIKHGNDHV